MFRRSGVAVFSQRQKIAKNKNKRSNALALSDLATKVSLEICRMQLMCIAAANLSIAAILHQHSITRQTQHKKRKYILFYKNANDLVNNLHL